MENYKSFYDERRVETYAHDYDSFRAEDHPQYSKLKRFVEENGLYDKKCLEIGSSGGFFQDLVKDYWGTDIAETLAKYYHKPYKVAKGSHYPFEDQTFDGIWTINVYEHIPQLQEALLEIQRLINTRGCVFFSPAWQCRPWAANGYAVRPYSDFDWKGKLIKASIPLRNSLLFRSLFIFPKRFVRFVMFMCAYSFTEIRYKKLQANYETYWTADADACNSIDPYDVILWFLSHGFECVSHPTIFSAFFVRTGALVFMKK